MTMSRIVAIAVFASLPLLGGCQGVQREASARVGGPAEPYARTWSVPGSPRPDTPADRDARKD